MWCWSENWASPCSLWFDVLLYRKLEQLLRRCWMCLTTLYNLSLDLVSPPQISPTDAFVSHGKCSSFERPYSSSSSSYLVAGLFRNMHPPHRLRRKGWQLHRTSIFLSVLSWGNLLSVWLLKLTKISCLLIYNAGK